MVTIYNTIVTLYYSCMIPPRDAKPVHPGRLLAENYMRPAGITQYRLAKASGLSPIQVSHIVRGKRAISAETAMRLGRFFGNSAEFWLNAQAQYDLQALGKQLARKIERDVIPLAAWLHAKKSG
jgi:addiction module HigA family antidote